MESIWSLTRPLAVVNGRGINANNVLGVLRPGSAEAANSGRFKQ